ncbi:MULTISPECIES: hypothetical protein [Methanobacterium]|uniref:hypothetical protein n=1 Tax=Methanobacterium TaxID=2160 RepID=UPI00159F1C8F|nr:MULTISPECIES: hypothetical protein [Methanobacterium]
MKLQTQITNLNSFSKQAQEKKSTGAMIVVKLPENRNSLTTSWINRGYKEI